MVVKFQDHPFSFGAIARIILSVLTVYLVWKASGVLIIILISIMLAAALHPVVFRLSKHIPFGISAFLAVIFLLLPFIVIGVTVLPNFVVQFPSVLDKVSALVNHSTFLPETFRNIDLNQYAESGGRYILRSTGVITNIVSSVVIVFVLTFYLIIDSERLIAIFLSIFHRNKRGRIKRLFSELAEINGQYVRGNLLISLICGILIFIGLVFLKVPYAMPLALFTAILDLLPLVGSSIGAIPAILLGFSVSPLTGILVIILYVVYQQIEGAFLSPTIYNKALKLSPALGFIAVIIGSSLFGITGAFLALPFAASLPAITEFIHEDLEDK